MTFAEWGDAPLPPLPANITIETVRRYGPGEAGFMGAVVLHKSHGALTVVERHARITSDEFEAIRLRWAEPVAALEAAE